MDIEARKALGQIGILWNDDFGVVDLATGKVLMYGYNDHRTEFTWWIPRITVEDADFKIFTSEEPAKEHEASAAFTEFLAQNPSHEVFDDAYLDRANWDNLISLLLHPKFDFAGSIEYPAAESDAKMRVFKVYGRLAGSQYRSSTDVADPRHNHDNELCFATSPKEAAEIVQQLWSENNVACKEFQVVEMDLPESEKDNKLIGVLSEPAGEGVTVKLPPLKPEATFKVKLIQSPEGSPNSSFGLYTADETHRCIDFVQSDWNYPALATQLGWSVSEVKDPKADCEHDSSDGTVDCRSCGVTAEQFMTAAFDWLASKNGEEFEIPQDA